MDNGASSYRRFLDGDKKAFEEIVKTYREGLTFFINRYVQDLAMAEDIAIDVFTELIVRPKRYNFSISLKTYLYMIGRSRALDYLRWRKRNATVDLSEVGDIPVAEKSMEDRFWETEQKKQIHEALHLLPKDMRIVVHLIYFEELSYEEAAKVMGKNRKQVDNLLYRAKAKLKTILRKEELF